MPTHWGATLGLVTGAVLTVADAVKRKRDGQTAEEILGGIGESFIGINYGAPEDTQEFRLETMRFTLPVLLGGVATKVAIWTDYNSMTMKGLNI